MFEMKTRAVAQIAILFSGSDCGNSRAKHRWIARPLPSTWEDSIRIQQNAWNLVKAGAPWTIFNNCQDFVSLSYDGKPGSVTRKVVAAGATIAILLGLL
jgi:hypothetical protein